MAVSSKGVREGGRPFLDDPLARGMTLNVEVEYPSTGVIDDGEAVEHTEVDCWNREEVHRSDGFPMISKAFMTLCCTLPTDRWR
jgi:hypothetical protein